MKSLLTGKRPGLDAVPGESHQISEEEMLILQKLRKSSREKHSPVSSNIIPTANPDKEITGRKKTTTIGQYPSYTWVQNSLTSINKSNPPKDDTSFPREAPPSKNPQKSTISIQHGATPYDGWENKTKPSPWGWRDMSPLTSPRHW